MSVRYINLDGLGNVDEFSAREIGEFMAEKLNEFIGVGEISNHVARGRIATPAIVLYWTVIQRLTGSALTFESDGTPLLDGQRIE